MIDLNALDSDFIIFPYRHKELESMAKSLKPLLKGEDGQDIQMVYNLSGINKFHYICKLLNELRDKNINIFELPITITPKNPSVFICFDYESYEIIKNKFKCKKAVIIISDEVDEKFVKKNNINLIVLCNYSYSEMESIIRSKIKSAFGKQIFSKEFIKYLSRTENIVYSLNILKRVSYELVTGSKDRLLLNEEIKLNEELKK